MMLRRNLINKSSTTLLRNLKLTDLKCLSTAIPEATNSFQHDFAEHHCPTNFWQRSVLTVGSAALSIINPHRGDMIACLGETTGEGALKYMKKQMEQSKEGIQILKEQPRINTKTVNLNYLQNLPHDTLGYAYYRFLEVNQVTPDSRMTVQFIDDIELAYVIQRYREVHDLIHTILQMPTNMLGEVTVKWVEALQFKLPMCISGAIFGPVRLKTNHRNLYLKHYLPWAIRTGTNAEFLLNIYFEKRWEQKLDDFYREVNIEPLVLEKKSDKMFK
ncbi:ubiquinone biosynthesis protein COQ4 homolog, mitochondrial [Anthonomus grandis grandis]|uniref:ubiquinone biosynthesis protein COQ4 homolog, mitochondrial n=1 Tax=Anthonomus grandis grandis TaxID=2921223 RepID=UPI002164FF5F|nr:ubiquinone biosynthesis protein COQ4 homolog, mitochondrial [Anthonomus grandis grandis]